MKRAAAALALVLGGASAVAAQAPEGAVQAPESRVPTPPAQPPAASPAAGSPLTFVVALELALARNGELAAARRGRAIREADVRAAGQYPNPDLSFEAARDVPHESLLLGMPLDVFGRRSSRIALAKEERGLADVEERAALLKLRRDLRLAFYGLVAADDGASLARSAVELAERVRDAAQARFETGAAPRLDVLQADLGLARARAELDLAEAARRGAQAELNAVLDRPAGESVTVAGDLADVPGLPDLATATSRASSTNPELLTAQREAAIEARRLAVLKAERAPVPTVSVGADFDAPGEFQVGGRAGVSLSVPLFSRNQGEIAGSLAHSAQLEERRRAVARSVEARVLSALAKAEAQRAQAETYRRTLVPTATSIESLAEESYRLGRTPVLAVLEAQRSLREVRSESAQSLLALQGALADLEDAIGGALE